MTPRPRARHLLALAALLAAPFASRAATYLPPAGYSASTVFSSERSIGGFDFADDGSLLVIENTSAGYSPASRLLRITPAGVTNTLHVFNPGVYANFVEVSGSQVYFGQSAPFGGGSPSDNRIMSVSLGGLGFTTNVVIQNYTLAFAPGGDGFFVGAPDFNNGVFRLSGNTTNQVIALPDFSAGLTFAPNGDLYLGQSLFNGGNFQNNLYRFAHAQITNAVAQGTVLTAANGTLLGTNLLGAGYLAADDDGDVFLSHYVDSGLLAYDSTNGTWGTFGSGDGVFTYLQFQPGSNSFDPYVSGGGTLFGYLSDFGDPAFNQIVAIRAVPEPTAVLSLLAAPLLARRRRRA